MSSAAYQSPWASDDVEMFRNTVRQFVHKEFVPQQARWREHQRPDAEAWTQAGRTGLLLPDLPEAYGGGGGTFAHAAVVLEELAHAGVHFGSGIQSIVAHYILAYGSEEQKSRWLPLMARGELVAAIAMSEPGAGSDLRSIQANARRDGDQYVINGSKTFITNGHRNSMILLVTKTDPGAGHHGFTLFLVPMDSPGVVRAKKLRKMGMHASDTALLSFTDVWVDDSAVLGTVGKGFEQIMWELQAERLIGAAGCLAYGQYAFDKTLTYARERHTFGRPLGQHQAIRHKFADMATKLEAARALIYQTARSYAAGEYPVREISMSKLLATQTAWEVADQCVQIHGGAGYMDEYDVSRVLRDIRLYRIGAGADEIMLDVIGKSYGF